MPRIEDKPNELRIIRETRGMSQADAASLCRVSRPMWSSWECKTRQITLGQMNMIRNKLSLTREEVLMILDWWGCEDELAPSIGTRALKEKARKKRFETVEISRLS